MCLFCSQGNNLLEEYCCTRAFVKLPAVAGASTNIITIQGHQNTMAPDPAAPGSIYNIEKFFFLGTIVYVAEVNQRCCLEERGQWLENVDRTHLVILASGKPVLQIHYNS